MQPLERDPTLLATLRSFYELGFLLYYVGRYPEAEPYLLQARPLYETLYGANDPETVCVLERVAVNYEHCPETGKDPEPYFQKAALALKPDGKHKYEYLANLCRWAECVAKRNRSEQADELYAELLGLIDASLERESEWHWIMTNCVEYFQSRGKSDLVAHLAAKEVDSPAAPAFPFDPGKVCSGTKRMRPGKLPGQTRNSCFN